MTSQDDTTLTHDLFLKGFARLAVVFPALNIQPDFYYELLMDLNDGYFMWAIMKICKEQKELFPNTNIVALIRGFEDEYQKERKKRIETKQLPYQEPDYESEEFKKSREGWKKMLQDLANKKGI